MHFITGGLLSLVFPIACVAAIYESFKDIPTSHFDFVIVGAGAAGSVVANRLTEDPRISVLLFEAGPTNIGVLDMTIPMFPLALSSNTPYDWNYTTAPLQVGFNGRSTPYPRGHVLGGSTSVNYMAYTRGSSEEWDRYARLSGDSGWSLDSVQQYIRDNKKWTPPADHHKRQANSTPLFTLDGHQLQNPGEFPFKIDMNSGTPLGVGWLQSTIKGGQRSSAATSYLGPSFISRPNLHVVVNTRVTRIIQTGVDHGNPAFRAVKVTQTEAGPRTTVTASKEVILSAGSVGTPQILLLSGIGNAKELSALGIKTIVDNPSVGANLTDHPLLVNTWHVNPTGTFDDITRNATLAAADVAAWQQTQTGVLVDSPLAHLVFKLAFANGWVRPTPIPATGDFMAVVTAVTSPSSVGTLTLNSSNPFDQPIINPNLLGSEFDLFVMTEAVAAARNFVKAKAWEGYGIREFEDLAAATTNATLEAYIRANTATVFHPVGTASMSPRGARFGVVDPDLLVKGVSALRIIDASILPLVPSAHTQGPVYIVGEKGAALVKSDYGLN
ncbi:aryl-alcohol oxidase [Mycena galericulata]|nr:aryl-alcohol oxidase [Mycena galericulata]